MKGRDRKSKDGRKDYDSKNREKNSKFFIVNLSSDIQEKIVSKK